VIAAAVEQVEGSERVDYLIVRDAIEGEGARQASLLWQRIQYLMDVAVIAPMVGLLGTVLGMLQSFAGMEVEMGVVKPLAVAAGVAKALITTVGGLIVGIVAMGLYALFRGRVNSLVGGLENGCGRVFRRLMAKTSRPT
jgi:biopolymer transport protein ExbB